MSASPFVTQKLKVLDLFSGIGGFSLGLERTGGFETVAFCDIEPFAQKVLKKNWPNVPIFPDVRTLDYDGTVDVITGGYPCQPFSTAGKRDGKEDDRHLWPAMFSLIKKYRPAWIIGENVAGHISMGLDDVLLDLESEGYTPRPFSVPACAIDAKHKRERVWIVANSSRIGHGQGREAGNISQADGRQDGQLCGQSCSTSSKPEALADTDRERQSQPQGLEQDQRGRISDGGKDVANTQRQRRQPVESSIPKGTQGKRAASPLSDGSGTGGWQGWEPEPAVGRVVDGIPNRVDRLRGLGNAVVPQIPEMIGYAILEAERQAA